MEIDHESSTPLYLQLAALLRAQVEAGTITKRLPSVKTLSQQHGVSHITAERALTTLKDEGLITPVIGKGYHVAGTLALPVMHSPLWTLAVSVPGPLPWLHRCRLVQKLTSDV